MRGKCRSEIAEVVPSRVGEELEMLLNASHSLRGRCPLEDSSLNFKLLALIAGGVPANLKVPLFGVSDASLRYE